MTDASRAQLSPAGDRLSASPAGARRGLWIMRLVFLAAVFAVIVALAKWSGWLALLLPVAVIAYALVAISLAARRGAAAASAFRAAHPEKDLLIVHSSDARSKEYIESELSDPRRADALQFVESQLGALLGGGDCR